MEATFSALKSYIDCDISNVDLFIESLKETINMESWHAAKFGKDDPLCSAIKTNSLSVHFFAVEVGVWAYCASTVISCLVCLGLTRKLLRSLKTLNGAALTASLEIWLCQQSWEWIIANPSDGITSTTIQSSIPKPPRHSKSKLPS